MSTAFPCRTNRSSHPNLPHITTDRLHIHARQRVSSRLRTRRVRSFLFLRSIRSALTRIERFRRAARGTASTVLSIPARLPPAYTALRAVNSQERRRRSFQRAQAHFLHHSSSSAFYKLSLRSLPSTTKSVILYSSAETVPMLSNEPYRCGYSPQRSHHEPESMPIVSCRYGRYAIY